ncbi:MAG: hypothetical protein RDV48_24330 [Candidatus Eremiobacteraeota bacterium]|nr:hypothetical protein [Candidatus Eremiobacteraeota bacterium]
MGNRPACVPRLWRPGAAVIKLPRMQKEQKTFIRFAAQSPIQATVYECERLRCNLCGSNSSLRWGDHIFAAFSLVNNENAFVAPFNFYPRSQIPDSNELDIVYCGCCFDTGLLPLGGDGNCATVNDIEGILAHETQHIMRWLRKVYESGHPYFPSSQFDTLVLDAPLNEGLSMYLECMVNRGFLFGDVFSKELRIYDLRNILSRSYRGSIFGGNNNPGLYSCGLLLMFWLADHYGLEDLAKLELPNGKLAQQSLEDVTGEVNRNTFMKFSMAQALSAETGINPEYHFTSIDLSGAIVYYRHWEKNYGLFPAASTISTYDSWLGWDITNAGPCDMNQYSVREWAVNHLRFYNGAGNTLTIPLAGLIPDPDAGGEFFVKVLIK